MEKMQLQVKTESRGGDDGDGQQETENFRLKDSIYCKVYEKPITLPLELTEAKDDVRKVVELRRSIEKAHAVRRHEADRRGRYSRGAKSRRA